MKEDTTNKRGGLSRVFCIMENHNLIREQAKGLSPKHLRYRGFGLAWTILVIFALLLLVGLSIDTGKLCLVMHQMHNAADAAVLAGTPHVKANEQKARDLAQQFAALNSADKHPVYLDRNDGNLAYGDIIIGRYTYNPNDGRSYFFRYDPDAVEPTPVNAMAVNVSRTLDRLDTGGPVPLIFGKLVNVFTADLEGSCVISDPDTYETIPNPDTGKIPHRHGPFAVAITAGGTGAGLICLRPDYIGLDMQGGSTLIVNNDLAQDPADGAIQVNSSWDTGLSIGGTGGESVNVEAYALNLWGKTYTSDPYYDFPNVDYINFKHPPIPDPLAGLEPPGEEYWNEITIVDPENPNKYIVEPGQITQISEGDDITLPPGYYSGGWRMTGGKLTLQSGVYILDAPAKGSEAGLYINGGILDASFETTGGGVMFYIAGNGVCYISGTSTVWADPMTDEGNEYQHMMIFHARDNIQEATIIGNGDSAISGTLYFPQKVDEFPQNPNTTQQFALTLGGTGAGFGNQVITDSLHIAGNSEVLINYDGRNPAPVTKAYLVE